MRWVTPEENETAPIIKNELRSGLPLTMCDKCYFRRIFAFAVLTSGQPFYKTACFARSTHMRSFTVTEQQGFIP